MPASVLEVPTLSFIPQFVPFGVLYYTQDTGNIYVGTGSSDPPNVELVASGGTPGGFSGDIQYNNAGQFGGSAATIDAPGNISALSVNATNGFQVATLATTGNYLRGNGTNFISSPIQAGDVPTPSIKWSDLQNATAALTLSNGNNGTELDHTSAVTIAVKNTTLSTSATSQSSPIVRLSGTYWTGAASAEDNWTIQDVVANGTNGSSTLTFTHSGSSGAPTAVFPAGTAGNASLAVGSATTGFWQVNSNTLGIQFTNVNGGGGAIQLYSGSTNAWQLTYAPSSGFTQLVSNTANIVTGIVGNLTTLSGRSGVCLGNPALAGTSAGTQHCVSIGDLTTNSGALCQFTPTSGATNFVALSVNPTINQTGTSSGNYTALLVSAKETSLKGTTNNLLDLQAGAAGTTSKFRVDNSGNAIAVGGYALSLVATSTISSVSPVKADTSNANQVVVTSTTDTGPGIVVGVCINNPNAGANGVILTNGIAPMVLGTGTVSIGNFIIVDTTTNGRVKATTSYPPPGSLIGIAMAAQSTVGNSFNVAVSLR